MRKYRYCGVFLFDGRLFLTEQEYVGGPRCLKFPPAELPMDISADSLGDEVLRGLASYLDRGRVIYADEWEQVNRRWIEHFKARSVAEFERRCKNVSVREDQSTGEVRVLGPGDALSSFVRPTARQIGEAAGRMLKLPRLA